MGGRFMLGIMALLRMCGRRATRHTRLGRLAAAAASTKA